MKLTRERIIDAGMAEFAESGYHGLSMRKVAQRLDAQAGSLYYHVPNKSALVQLMADRVACQAYDAGTAALSALDPGADWQDRVQAQLIALSESIRRHPGGAVMLAGSPKVLSTGALSLMERLLETLHGAGIPADHAAIGADTLLSHTTGFVLQEQSQSPIMDISAEEAATVHARFPRTVAAASAFTEDDTFLRSVRLVCVGLAALTDAAR
ncbi:TetR/AcrR family transcriptional regulator [Streptomyces sp. NPDC102409]|uniref:TetR/AcrR family transcriptional regulator n=1 Tax=Streptomyces sp. NPDC102409 TaxID=3366172 RepID=UPI00381EBB2A